MKIATITIHTPPQGRVEPMKFVNVNLSKKKKKRKRKICDCKLIRGKKVDL